jgi:hypothetical protein
LSVSAAQPPTVLGTIDATVYSTLYPAFESPHQPAESSSIHAAHIPPHDGAFGSTLKPTLVCSHCATESPTNCFAECRAFLAAVVSAHGATFCPTVEYAVDSALDPAL